MNTTRGERGQNLVEFALVLPMLFLVVAGIFEFGNLLKTQIQIQNAVREGARFAALKSCNATDAAIQAKVQFVAAGLSITTTTTYSPTPCSSCGRVAVGVPTVKVDGSYTYNAISPLGGLMGFFGGTFGSTLNLTSTSTFNNEC